MICPYCRVDMYILDEEDAVSLVYNPLNAQILSCPDCEYMSIEFDEDLDEE